MQQLAYLGVEALYINTGSGGGFSLILPSQQSPEDYTITPWCSAESLSNTQRGGEEENKRDDVGQKCPYTYLHVLTQLALR